MQVENFLIQLTFSNQNCPIARDNKKVAEEQNLRTNDFSESLLTSILLRQGRAYRAPLHARVI